MSRVRQLVFEQVNYKIKAGSVQKYMYLQVHVGHSFRGKSVFFDVLFLVVLAIQTSSTEFSGKRHLMTFVFNLYVRLLFVNCRKNCVLYIGYNCVIYLVAYHVWN